MFGRKMRNQGMKAGRQTTVREQVSVSGVGVHSGLPATLTIHPADVDSGVVFVPAGAAGERAIRAHVHAITASDFATVIGDADGPCVSTIEHVLAALLGLGVDNAVIEIDGAEAPIMDGSAAPFVEAIDAAGLTVLPAPRRYIKVLKPVRVSRNGALGELRPYDRGFRVESEIDFDHPLIGRQTIAVDIEPAAFRRDIARARTFGFMRDVAKMWSAGYALGATFENTVVLAENRVLNQDGLRYPDEFVRHKALDAVGDLALAGAPLLGAYRSVRGGHKLNHAVLSALLADRSAWAYVEATEERRRVRGHAAVASLTAPAYGPDVS
jgi:UDP-3-O-[3-hydroxymyristoyl] N-acetylglucosamine deacetylase